SEYQPIVPAASFNPASRASHARWHPKRARALQAWLRISPGSVVRTSHAVRQPRNPQPGLWDIRSGPMRIPEADLPSTMDQRSEMLNVAIRGVAVMLAVVGPDSATPAQPPVLPNTGPLAGDSQGYTNE